MITKRYGFEIGDVITKRYVFEIGDVITRRYGFEIGDAVTKRYGFGIADVIELRPTPTISSVCCFAQKSSSLAPALRLRNLRWPVAYVSGVLTGVKLLSRRRFAKGPDSNEVARG